MKPGIGRAARGPRPGSGPSPGRGPRAALPASGASTGAGRLRARRPGLAALFAVLVALGAAAVAGAQGAPTLSVQPASVSPGESITVSGEGWDADEDVTIVSTLGG